MVLYPTDEMKHLDKIFRPYMNGAVINENAPEEAVEAHKKYKTLMKRQTEDEIKSWFE